MKDFRQLWIWLSLSLQTELGYSWEVYLAPNGPSLSRFQVPDLMPSADGMARTPGAPECQLDTWSSRRCTSAIKRIKVATASQGYSEAWKGWAVFV